MSVTIATKSVTYGRPIFGTWTHTEGEAEESVSLLGTVLYGSVAAIDSSGQIDPGIRWSESYSTSTGKTTITIHYGGTVTTGRFCFWMGSA